MNLASELRNLVKEIKAVQSLESAAIPDCMRLTEIQGDYRDTLFFEIPFPGAARLFYSRVGVESGDYIDGTTTIEVSVYAPEFLNAGWPGARSHPLWRKYETGFTNHMISSGLVDEIDAAKKTFYRLPATRSIRLNFCPGIIPLPMQGKFWLKMHELPRETEEILSRAYSSDWSFNITEHGRMDYWPEGDGWFVPTGATNYQYRPDREVDLRFWPLKGEEAVWHATITSQALESGALEAFFRHVDYTPYLF